MLIAAVTIGYEDLNGISLSVMETLQRCLVNSEDPDKMAKYRWSGVKNSYLWFLRFSGETKNSITLTRIVLYC